VIVYQSTKSGFLSDTDNRNIEDVVVEAYLRRTGQRAPANQLRAWESSLHHMAKVLRDEAIPDDIGVGIEYGIPQSSMRIDFVLTGRSETQEPSAIIVELKQWSESRATDKDGIVIARRGGAREREGAHPSYQAWSYAMLLRGFNEAVYENDLDLRPCAYLHNYVADGNIDSPRYAPYIDKAPLFLKGEDELRRLREFVKRHVRHGDKGDLLYTIENGRIRPSKVLADSVGKMLKGNPEFVLIDDQKVVYESVLALAKGVGEGQKRVVIIKGGPGTGKSLIAINLLAALMKPGFNARYVSKNAAPRSVYKSKLAGQISQAQIANLFSGSGAFVDPKPNLFDVLLVDEAHRLNEFSGLYANLGENQIKELIVSARCCVFFVDDEQMVTLADIGHSGEIERWAVSLGADVTRLELHSQFRCNGSGGYLPWLDDVLGVSEDEDAQFDPMQFDFRVVDSPNELHELIADRNASNRSRMVAGYCWDWKSKRDPGAFDIVLSDTYKKRWNLASDGSLWIIARHSVDEIGCIHTCQGLEVDYVGVIIGPDLLYRSGRLTTFVENRSGMDRSVRGYRQAMRADPVGTADRLDKIIRNTYRTLMTRGMKGCYIHCVDPETNAYFKSRLGVGG
jgi:DUF2075 family protein